jgi:hypothetical protein
MTCLQCSKPLTDEERLAAITGSLLGDEVCDVWFLCSVCGVYTVVSWWDDFTGEETMSRRGPIPRTEGDERVALIKNCSTSWDKSCQCEVHVQYFRGVRD